MRLLFCLAALVLFLLPTPVFGQMPVPIPGVRTEVRGSGFGFSVAASGTRLAVSDAESSRIFLYEYDGGGWHLTSTLALNDRILFGPGARAGGLALDGSRLAVGAPGAGLVLVYDFDGAEWQRTAVLAPSVREAGAEFGVSVALVRDRMVVGQTGSEAAYVFVREAASGTWTQEARLVSGLTPDPNSGGNASVCFGWTVALRDREIAVSGHCPNSAAGLPNGRVFRFLSGPSGWEAAAPIAPPPGVTWGGVTFAGDHLVVGSSRGWHVYGGGSEGRTLVAVLASGLESHRSEYAHALAGIDGVFVGMGYDPIARLSGVARFEGGGDRWESVVLGAFQPVPTGGLNARVTLSARHTMLGDLSQGFALVRDRDSGAIDTLRMPDGGTRFDAGTRASRGIDFYAGHLIVGMTGSDLDAPAGYADRRGGAVVLRPDRSAIAVHGPLDQRNAGSLVGVGDGFFVSGNARHYTVYRADGSVWRSVALPESQTLQAVSARGTTLAVGTFSSATSSGTVELLRCSAGSDCVSEAVLKRTPLSGYENERFGFSLALDRSGTHLVVGAPVIGGPVISSVAPRVSLYAREASGVWRPDGEIAMPGASSGGSVPLDTYARSVARTRDTVAVNSMGNLYVFVRGTGQTTFRTVARFSVATPSSLTPALAIGAGRIAHGIPSSLPGLTGVVDLFRGATTGTGWVHDRTLDGGLTGGVSFGTTLAIDGTRLVVGAPLSANGAGEVYAFDLGTGVSVEREATTKASPLALRMPNPIRGTATVHYQLDTPATVRLTIYDMLGRRVATVVEGGRASGAYETPFPAGVAPGAYVVRLDADGRHVTRTVVVLP